MSQTIIDLLNDGTEANKNDSFRKDNLILLPTESNLVITGDIHGHRRNFEKITTFADLENNPNRHVLLQEIIHGGKHNEQGGCLSYKLLFDVVRYKLNYPGRVHTIMGNHDTACISDSEVMKDGKEMNRAMAQALKEEFGDATDDVKSAIRRFLFSQPLAVRCSNRIWISHSLPSSRFVDKFDPAIFERQLTDNDIVKPGSAYLLTWGRAHSQELLDRMAQMLDTDIFILGHQPQQTGWQQTGENLIIIASEHNHGCLLHIDLSKTYTMPQLVDSIIPLASIA